MGYRDGWKRNKKNPVLKCLQPVIFLFFLITAVTVFPQAGYKQLAVGLLRAEKYIEAIRMINTGLEREPSSSDLFFLRGFARYSLDDLIGAEKDYSTAIMISPYMSDALNYRAIVRSQLQNFTGAFEDFALAMELDSANAEIYVNRARVNLTVKRYYNCIVDCNQAIKLKSDNEGVYLLRGSAKLALKRYDEALEDFDKAIAVSPANPYGYTQRGMVWLEQEKTDSAIVDLTRAIEVDSNNTYALFNRALAFSKSKEHQKAILDLDKVIRLSPYNSYAYYNRAISKIETGDRKNAIKDLEVVSKLDPQNIISYYYRSRLKVELKDYPGALQDLNKTLELYPEYTDAYYERYQVKLKLKDRKGAMEDFRHVEELGKTNHLTPDSLKKKQENYLKSLVKLSGDFEEMNTLNSKFQNQHIEIRLLPMYIEVTGKKDLTGMKIYDAYKEAHFYTHFIILGESGQSIPDSVISKTIPELTAGIDSLRDATGFYRRATAYAALKQYENAIQDYDTVLQLDPNFLMAWLGRAEARYELISEIQSAKEEPEAITIRTGAGKHKVTEIPGEVIHTLEKVLVDLNQVIALDGDFPYGFYNRGYINCKMGNYHAAIEDFSMAVEKKPDFGEALYNRGLISLLLLKAKEGCEDLSKAGELGILDSYRVMKRYCFK